MLLVDNDEAEVRKRGEKSASRAHDHTRCARANEIPLVEALALAHARVHDGHRVAEATAKAPHRLRRERYLGHQHACRATGGKCCLDSLQIHLCLA